MHELVAIGCELEAMTGAGEDVVRGGGHWLHSTVRGHHGEVMMHQQLMPNDVIGRE